MRYLRALDLSMAGAVTAAGAAIIGLGASITALIDDLGTTPTFCSAAGCEVVRTSAWARPLGIPWSALGIAFFAIAIGLAFVSAPRLRRALAILGASSAIGLIAVQGLLIGAWCKLCLVADSAAILHGAIVLAGAQVISGSRRRGWWVVPAVATVVGYLGWWTQAVAPASTQPGLEASAARSELPPSIAAVQQPGIATIVEFVDFECPYCRALQRQLDEAIAGAKAPVRLIRKMVPLPQHPHAMTAAVAWCCAEAQGRGDAMAAALFAADPEQLSASGCEAIAVGIGCDLARYRHDAPSMGVQIQQAIAEAKAAHVDGLPTLYIGAQRVTGSAHSSADLAAMIERAARS
jgi:uncharacterized membrane protein/predicted DsbA family dithiol-disulfide isomerase